MKYILSIFLFMAPLAASEFTDLKEYILSERYACSNEMYIYEVNHHFPPEYWVLKGKVLAYREIIMQMEDLRDSSY